MNGWAALAVWALCFAVIVVSVTVEDPVGGCVRRAWSHADRLACLQVRP